MHRKRLRIALACDVPYESMAPRDGGRHCAECDRVVTNVSAMTKREAIALYESAGFVAVERFNDDPHATHFFERALD